MKSLAVQLVDIHKISSRSAKWEASRRQPTYTKVFKASPNFVSFIAVWNSADVSLKSDALARCYPMDAFFVAIEVVLCTKAVRYASTKLLVTFERFYMPEDMFPFG